MYTQKPKLQHNYENHGDEHPKLQRFVIRELSLTCSFSNCEHNWSVIEKVKI